MDCPNCGLADPIKVIYFGFPMTLCTDEACGSVWGCWTFILDLIPSEDKDWIFFVYKNSYLLGLWQWLKAGAR